jgi:hypothetical protein
MSKIFSIDTGEGRGFRPLRRRALLAAAAIAAVGGSLLTSPSAASAASVPSVPGPVQAVGAASDGFAPAAGQFDNDLVVAAVQVGGQGRFYWNLPTSSFSTGWNEIPGAGRGDRQPAVVRVGERGRNVVAVRGTDKRFWIQNAYDSWVGKSWDAGWGALKSRQFNSPPQMSYNEVNNKIVVTGVGLDGLPYWIGFDYDTGVWDTDWMPANTPKPIAPNTGVATTVVNGQIVFAMTAADGGVYVGGFYSSGFGIGWRYLGNSNGKHTPALAVTGGNVLHVVVQSSAYNNPNGLITQAARITGPVDAQPAQGGPSWGAWQFVPGGGQFAPGSFGEGPSASTTKTGKMRIYGRGLDGGLWSLAVEPKSSSDLTLKMTDGYTGWRPVAGSTPTPLPPTTPPPPPPAVKKADLLWSGSATVNSSKNVEMTFKNGGTLAAGPFRVSAMVGFSEIDQCVYQGLGVGATTLQTIATSNFPAGSYTLNMVLDSYTAVAESNENNNGKSVTFTKYPNGEVVINN